MKNQDSTQTRNKRIWWVSQLEHKRATKIEDPTQTKNNRIWKGSLNYCRDNYLGTRHYKRCLASAGCSISHNAMYLNNYPLNIVGWTVHEWFRSTRVRVSVLCHRMFAILRTWWWHSCRTQWEGRKSFTCANKKLKQHHRYATQLTW